MTLALLDILTDATYADASRQTVDNGQQIFCSIQTHLHHLLNTRQGALKHMPDYGLPDVTEIYQGLPYSLSKLVEAVRYTITYYEPRLTEIQIKAQQLNEQHCVLRLQIIGKLRKGTLLTFNTYFTTNGKAKFFSSS